MERLIPLRFINLLDCNPGAGCPDNANYVDILRAVESANAVFKAAGIQFWLKLVERYNVPSFAKLMPQSCGGTNDVPFTWGQVKTQLRTLVPETPLNAWDDTLNAKLPRVWLKSVNTIYSNQEELIIWLPKFTACGGGGAATGNIHNGRSLVFRGGIMVERYKLAHELGHFFGIGHTWNSSDSKPDPKTLAPVRRADDWDLFYLPGTGPSNPHKFFSSPQEACGPGPLPCGNESSLRPIHTRKTNQQGQTVPNCDADAMGLVTCQVRNCAPDDTCYTEVHTTGSPALKGTAFEFGTMNGPNVMSYTTLGGTGPRAFSDSQIAKIRRYIRWAVPAPQASVDEMKPGLVLSSNLPRLGSWNLRETASKIDFDGDGKRDLGFWIPPTIAGVSGRFMVLLSSRNFSVEAGESMEIYFGEIGDVPVPADYGCAVGQPGCTTGAEPDGRTDLAVFQPGGGYNRNDPPALQAFWRWCPTRGLAEQMTTCNCATAGCPTYFADCDNNPANGCESRIATPWGLREDVPLPGTNFLGSSTTEVAIFRPRQDGRWVWRAAHSTSSGTAFNVGARGAVPLHGLYDNDALTDLAVYEPGQATFKMRLSSQSWATETSRCFGTLDGSGNCVSNFIPKPSGTQGERAGALPLSGMRYPRSGQPRRALSLWYAHDGTWNTMWDPIAGSAIQTCQWGGGTFDLPIPGIDFNQDGYSDMVVYWPPDNVTLGEVFGSSSSPSGCTGSGWLHVPIPGSPSIRQRVLAVQDRTGDAWEEILVIDPDMMRVRWFTSESGYGVMHERVIGHERAIFF
jgi:hypothetical protein